MSEYTYISAVDTAKLVRGALKRAFPGVKFSVRSPHGSEIRVQWTDGPSEPAVKRVISAYDGGGFDSMIDLSYNSYSWLNPKTGEAAFAQTDGTTGSMGTVAPAQVDNPWPGVGKLVSFGAKYVFTSRRFTRETLEKALATVTERYGVPAPEIHDYGDGWEPVLNPCSDAWQAHAFSEAVREYNAYEPPAQVAQADKAEEIGLDQADDGGIALQHDRDWTWLYAQGEPGAALKTAIRDLGFVHSAKRSAIRGCGAWYAKERLDLSTTLETLRAAYWADYKTAHSDFTDPNEPLGPGGGPSYGADRAAVVRADWKGAQPLVLSW